MVDASQESVKYSKRLNSCHKALCGNNALPSLVSMQCTCLAINSWS